MMPFDKEHNQFVLNRLAEQGVELTPDELIEQRKEAFAKIRSGLLAKGWDVPDSDEDLFLLMMEVKHSEDE